MLKINRLTKSYFKKDSENGRTERFHAIKEITFEIEKGEILGIVGVSGSGKTTLLRCILQLTRPDKGDVFFERKNLVHLDSDELRREVRPYLRKVYQHPESALNPGLTVEQILSQPVALYHPELQNSKMDRVVNELMKDVGLPGEYKSKYPHQLSGGEKRRVALARALATNPKVLFADEPFAGLDKALQYRMLKLLLGIKQERDLTIVMVSHDVDVIQHVCDRIITLKEGKMADIAKAGENGVPVNMDHFR